MRHLFPAQDLCDEDDQIACNMCGKKAESEEAGDIRAAGDHAEHGREQPFTTGTLDLRR